MKRNHASKQDEQCPPQVETATHAGGQAFLESTSTGMAIMRWPEQTISQANQAFATIFGHDQTDMLTGWHFGRLCSDTFAYRQVEHLCACTIEHGSASLRGLSCLSRKGTNLSVDIHGVKMGDMEGNVTIAWTVVDIQRRHPGAEQLSYRARHAPLTTLPNRQGLIEHLEWAMAVARRHQTKLAVGFINLDMFKQVNDQWGVDTGDRLLQQFATRLRGQLRDSDLLAHLGGDAFALVLQDLDETQPLTKLRAGLSRLHQPVESPFELPGGHQISTELRMGIALYPQDADTPEGLVRLASTNMNEINRHKDGHKAPPWWQLRSPEGHYSEVETELTPYDVTARELLRRHQYVFAGIADRFTEAFKTHTHQDREAEAILKILPEEERDRLTRIQADYLLFLTHPDTDSATLHERARRAGTAHGMTGVSATLMVHAHRLYQRLLANHLDQIPIRPRDRYRLLLIAEARLWEDLQTELDTLNVLRNHILAVNAEPMPTPGERWTDVATQETNRIGSLPGIRAAILLRPNTEGVLTVEANAGPVGDQAASILRTPGRQPVIDPEHPLGQGVAAQSWRQLRILRTPSIMAHSGHKPWQEPACDADIHSVLAVPIRDNGGHAAAVIVLYGAWPNQFESELYLPHWAEALQQRWERLWHQSHRPTVVIPQHDAELWRTRLFSGGLKPCLQPIVNLNTGEVEKAEILVRLALEDGKLIPPNQFLPLLGAAELYRLFRLMLDSALNTLSSRLPQENQLTISVNLPPSALREPDLEDHVRKSLETHGVAPERLVLELLETDTMPLEEQHTAIHRLKAVGVRLALDDLGSGYSSLLRLIHQPLDTLKIDQNLLQRLPKDPIPTLTLLWTLLLLGRELERDVIVEGVETPALIEVVQQLGMAKGQGFALGRPVALEEFPDWLKRFRFRRNAHQFGTFSGALAYHWRWQRSGHQRPQADCPLRRFLHAKGAILDEPGHWLDQIHSGGAAGEESSQRLLDWLAKQVREEAA